MKKVKLGIDELPAFLKKKFAPLKKKHVSVLCHTASLNQKLDHLEHILEKEANVISLFGPQHGIYGETQDNMIEWQDFKDEKGRNIYSLYGKTRKPAADSLNGVDLMVIDLFDVGARYYTFIYTMAYMMEACAEQNIPVVVCDRPNPLGGNLVEGPILDLNFRSFVGLFEITTCHGMTIGELAKLFNKRAFSKPCELHVVPLKNWKRKDIFTDLDLRWPLPSPNMPNFEACLLYPGMCLIEGTTLSEGRGTTRPFELIGAPFINWAHVEKEYIKIGRSLKLAPVRFLRQGFIPTFHKYKGELCRGVIQVVEKPQQFYPLRHMAILFWILRQLYQTQWNWSKPPYEYEYEKWPIDILSGNTDLRETVDNGGSLKTLFNKWKQDEETFKKIRKPYLIY